MVFAQDLVLAIARTQREQAAKALGYLINGNVTYGGGYVQSVTACRRAQSQI